MKILGNGSFFFCLLESRIWLKVVFCDFYHLDCILYLRAYHWVLCASGILHTGDSDHTALPWGKDTGPLLGTHWCWASVWKICVSLCVCVRVTRWSHSLHLFPIVWRKLIFEIKNATPYLHSFHLFRGWEWIAAVISWCLCVRVYDRALRGPAEARISHWRLSFINTSINNNQNAGWPEHVVYTSEEFNYAAGSGETRYDCQGDISFAMNHGTGRNNSGLPHYNCVTLFVCPFVVFSCAILFLSLWNFFLGQSQDLSFFYYLGLGHFVCLPFP